MQKSSLENVAESVIKWCQDNLPNSILPNAILPYAILPNLPFYPIYPIAKLTRKTI